jgi:hypothetical protein
MNIKEWSYPVSATWTNNKDQKEHYATNLYQTGVYLIINDKPKLQFNLTPQDMQDTYEAMLEDEEAGHLSDIKWGRKIVVIKEKGFYKEKV